MYDPNAMWHANRRPTTPVYRPQVQRPQPVFRPQNGLAQLGSGGYRPNDPVQTPGQYPTIGGYLPNELGAYANSGNKPPGNWGFNDGPVQQPGYNTGIVPPNMGKPAPLWNFGDGNRMPPQMPLGWRIGMRGRGGWG